MKYLFLLFSFSLILVQCKKPFKFKHSYYLVENDSPYPSYAISLDSLGYFVTIGSGYDSIFPAEVSDDSISFYLPCLYHRHAYSYNVDTLFIHSLYGTYKLTPIDSITQEILFANELVNLQIEEGKGELKSPVKDLRCEIKVGYSLRDSVDGFTMQINDDIIDFEDLKVFQDEIGTYDERLDILLFFHKEFPLKERKLLISELMSNSKLDLHKAYFDTTDIDFVSFNKINASHELD